MLGHVTSSYHSAELGRVSRSVVGGERAPVDRLGHADGEVARDSGVVVAAGEPGGVDRVRVHQAQGRVLGRGGGPPRAAAEQLLARLEQHLDDVPRHVEPGAAGAAHAVPEER